MANTLTSLINPIFEALEKVSRERIGFITAVRVNASAERAALNQTIKIPVAGDSALADNTPGVTAPDTGDADSGTIDMTISRSKHYPIRMNGEETTALRNSGNYEDWMRQRFEKAFRTLSNAVESDLASTYAQASRAFGTASTTPFGTANSLADFAGLRRILDDNGAPETDLQLVLSNAAIEKLRGVQSSLFKVNEAGSSDLLRNGMTDRVQGFALRQSGQMKSHAKGTGSGYLVNDATPPGIGDTSITTDTGTGTIKAGDVVTLAGDTNKYVVAADHADNTLVINEPGLMIATTDNAAITVGAAYNVAGLAFDRDAIQFIARAPARPEGGDMADDIMMVQDPVSGLFYEVALYRQYRQVHIEVALAWGWKAIKPAHIALLLG